MKPLHLIELIALGAIWGASFMFTRLSVADFGIPALIATRVVISALVLSPWLFSSQRRAELGSLRAGKWGAAAALGLINTAIPFALLAYTVQHIGAGFASILNATAALFGALLAWLWLGERLTGFRTLGLVVGFAGVVLLSWHKLGFSTTAGPWPVLTGLGGGFLYGLSLNFTKRYLAGVRPMTVAAASQVFAALAMIPVGIAFAPTDLPGPRALAAALVLGLVCTGFAYVLFYRLFVSIGPTRAITVAFLIPMFGVVWGVVFLNETFTLVMGAGAALVLMGLSMSTGLVKWPLAGRSTTAS